MTLLKKLWMVGYAGVLWNEKYFQEIFPYQLLENAVKATVYYITNNIVDKEATSGSFVPNTYTSEKKFFEYCKSVNFHVKNNLKVKGLLLYH